LARLERAAFGAEAWTEDMLADEVTAPGRAYFAVSDGQGGLAGYGGVFLGMDVAEVMTVGVDPACQGRGLGRTLMNQLLATAHGAGMKAIMLEVAVDNAVAFGLYQSLGFRVTRRRRGYYQPSGTDANEMRLDFH
jgi:ribosomal-protein-alanine N-acetyltransferase